MLKQGGIDSLETPETRTNGESEVCRWSPGASEHDGIKELSRQAALIESGGLPPESAVVLNLLTLSCEAFVSFWSQ